MKILFVAAVVLLIPANAGAQTNAKTEPSAFELQRQAAQDAAVLPDKFRRAKNIILFLGDGMGISTITAARILDGQNKGGSGESHQLFFEQFEYTALSKTYALNQQTADSASTMTAIMTGHKTTAYTVGYDENIVLADHTSTLEYGGPSRPVETLLEWFEKRGRATGIVTTTRITHATPACCYAHSADRNWESGAYTEKSDESLKAAMKAGVKDIARQLIEFPFGDGVDVALGGGRAAFLPKAKDSNETASPAGDRIDDRNLIAEWLRQPNAKYVASRKELLGSGPSNEGRLLGLFSEDHMTYVTDLKDSNPNDEPSLSEMAVAALKIVQKNDRGFFLMVEGGRIDHAHHSSNAHRALEETIEFDNAVRTVFEELTEQQRSETLVIVTADHSHTMTIAGYPTRGNPILGKVIGNDKHGKPEKKWTTDALGMPYTTLSYANGPGFPGMMIDKDKLTAVQGVGSWTNLTRLSSGSMKFLNTSRPARPNLSEVATESEDYVQESAVPMSETHGGEDVAIYARGPGAHLFRGTREQNYIYHAMRLALSMSPP